MAVIMITSNGVEMGAVEAGEQGFHSEGRYLPSTASLINLFLDV
jgi:hypothetical protein